MKWLDNIVTYSKIAAKYAAFGYVIVKTIEFFSKECENLQLDIKELKNGLKEQKNNE